MTEGQLLPALFCALLVGLTIALVPAATPPAAWSVTASRPRGPDAPGSKVAAPTEAPAERSPDAATLLDFAAAMLRAGVGIEPAVQRLSQDVPGCQPLARVHRGLRAGQRWQDAWSCVDSHPQLREFGVELAFAHSTGAPTVQLLELTADHARRRRRQSVEEKAARLAVQMVLPLGLCFLPGFILLGVVPVVLGLVGELA